MDYVCIAPNKILLHIKNISNFEVPKLWLIQGSES